MGFRKFDKVASVVEIFHDFVRFLVQWTFFWAFHFFWVRLNEAGLYESSRAVTQVDGLPPASSVWNSLLLVLALFDRVRY